MKLVLKSALLGFFLSLAGLSQAADDEVYRFWVVLKDKANSAYSINKPQEFLTQRAIDRRVRSKVSITEQDLPVNQSYLQQITGAGVKILGVSRWMNAVLVECKTKEEGSKLTTLSAVKEVMYMGKASLKKKEDIAEVYDAQPQQPEDMKSDGTLESYGSALNQISQLRGVDVHQAGYMGQGMVIAVIDAGFYKVNSLKPFEYLRANGGILGTRDFVEGNDSVYEDDTHGMQVLSCMAGYYPNRMIGTAPKAKYWLLRSEDTSLEYPFEEAFWVIAAEFADSVGADVINGSVGYNKYDDPALDYTAKQLDGKSTLVSQAARIAFEKGMIVVVSAGNEGDNSWKTITVPGDADGVIAVAAVNEKGKRASFSSTGPSADKRVKPDLAAMGERAAVATTYNGVWTSNGTSFASPVLAGIITCIWQSNGDRSNEQVLKALKASASQFNTPDDQLGYGIPNATLANRMLGGDRSFDYGKDQMVELFADESFSYIVFNFYSAAEQSIKVELKSAGGEVILSKTYKAGSRSFTKEKLSGFKKLKAGVYKLTVTGSSGSVVNYDIIRD